MRPLRILHVITRLDKGGSAENTLLTVLGNLAHGHHVELIGGVSENPESENEEMARKNGAVITRFKTLVREISPVNDIVVTVQLFLYMKKHPCDVLHTHTSKAGIVARIAGILAGVRCIVHTPHGHIFYGYFSPFKVRILTAVERFVTNKTDALITLTKSARKDYLDRNIGTPDWVVPILSGIDLKPFMSDDIDKADVRKELGLPPDSFIAGTVARLVQVKNHDVIVSAVEQLGSSIPNLICVFAGDGDLREHLLERIKKAGIANRFVFLGWRNDTPRLLKAFDLFVMCSHNEGMGRAFVEAQASGLPVIGSRRGGIPEVLLEGKTGYMVSPDDHAALAECMKKMYNERDKSHEIAKVCREWVNPKFSKETMVDSIERLYERCLNKKA